MALLRSTRLLLPGLLLGVGLGLGAGGCTPDVGSGAYFCGPEKLCPPGLACDGPSFTCVQQSHVEAFVCPGPEGLDPHEPDGDASSAWTIETFDCGQFLVEDSEGCIGQSGDTDVVAFTGAACIGDHPRVSVNISFPIAFVPLTLEVRDAAGTVRASGTPCTPALNYSGMETLCLEVEVTAGEAYTVHVAPVAGAPDCDSGCSRTLYHLTIQSLLT